MLSFVISCWPRHSTIQHNTGLSLQASALILPVADSYYPVALGCMADDASQMYRSLSNPDPLVSGAPTTPPTTNSSLPQSTPLSHSSTNISDIPRSQNTLKDQMAREIDGWVGEVTVPVFCKYIFKQSFESLEHTAQDIMTALCSSSPFDPATSEAGSPSMELYRISAS